MRTLRNWVILAFGLAVPFVQIGCVPYSMGIFTPIAVPAWVQERMEEKLCVGKNDGRTAILPPLRDGYPLPLCEDPPDMAQILRAMPRVARGVPYFYEEHRDDIEVFSERIVDKIDPPRFFPPVGMAQLHHCHWKCTVYYTETRESSYPFPFRCREPRIQVVLIDKDHLHLYPCGVPEAKASVARDLRMP